MTFLWKTPGLIFHGGCALCGMKALLCLGGSVGAKVPIFWELLGPNWDSWWEKLGWAGRALAVPQSIFWERDSQLGWMFQLQRGWEAAEETAK